MHPVVEEQFIEVTVTYLGGVQFEAETRGHKIYSDQPTANHGFDEGMTPPELLLTSVGTCAGYYAAEYPEIQEHIRECQQCVVFVESLKTSFRASRELHPHEQVQELPEAIMARLAAAWKASLSRRTR